MRSLIAFPLLILALILQTAVLGRIPLLAGFADLSLLILAAWSLQESVTTAWHWALLASLLTAFVSAVPAPVFFLGYLSVVGMGLLLRKRVWQAPLLAMFAVVFAGTLWMHLATYAVLRVLGNPLDLAESFMSVTVPSLLMNLLLSVVVYPLIRDLAGWVHPQEALS